jgi:hypothetical protein
LAARQLPVRPLGHLPLLLLNQDIAGGEQMRGRPVLGAGGRAAAAGERRGDRGLIAACAFVLWTAENQPAWPGQARRRGPGLRRRRDRPRETVLGAAEISEKI